jgi:hypothetical protein
MERIFIEMAVIGILLVMSASVTLRRVFSPHKVVEGQTAPTRIELLQAETLTVASIFTTFILIALTSDLLIDVLSHLTR